MFEITVVSLLLVLLAVGLVSFVKVRRIDRCLWDIDTKRKQDLSNIFHQLEALASLNQLLGFRASLPSTRGWAGSPDFLLVLANHALERQPLHMLECSSGASTLVLARCAQINGRGHVYSLEHDPAFAEKTREQLRRQRLEEFATILDSPLMPVPDHANLASNRWYSLGNLPDLPFDMLVIDGPPAVVDTKARMPAGPLLFKRMASGASIFLDDADRSGEREIAAHWLATVPGLRMEHLGCEKGLAKFSI
jgi:predicted O-methyltransferase YrrM